tara:strand:- start:475 stop:819 length:345 start_codon:yes stop_codon:yes gene_type:complete
MKFEKVNPATGAAAPGFSRGTEKYAGNQHMKTNSDALINKGRGPTVGNKSDDDSTYPDAARVPKSGQGKDMFTGSAQVRTPGGTRAWEPKAEQNYKGNADKINLGRGPTKGNQR